MPQGIENDLLDVRFYLESTSVIFNRSNEPFEDINNNTLAIDNKAIAARDTALTVQTDLGNHLGQGGVLEHAVATLTEAGFMSAADKAKLDRIQEQAQLNILAPVDAIELISRKDTTLHAHPEATTLIPGFISAADKGKLDGIASGAQVNNISNGDVITLTTGGNADALHGHSFAPGTEGFTEAVHAGTNHTGLPGIPSFPGFATSGWIESTEQSGPGVTVFSNPYGAFTSLEVVAGGWRYIRDLGWWGLTEAFSINDISVIGNTGTITFEVLAGGFGDMQARCWQVGFGVV
jgi:hypothetical protein